MVSRTVPRLGFMVNRGNRVPYYQRLYQARSDVRLWRRGPLSRYLLIPYHISLWGAFAASMYGIGRVVLGHRTFFGKG